MSKNACKTMPFTTKLFKVKMRIWFLPQPLCRNKQHFAVTVTFRILNAAITTPTASMCCKKNGLLDGAFDKIRCHV